MKNKDIKQFKNSDFYLSSFLLAKGLVLNGIDNENPRRIFFVFEDVENRENLVEDFLFGRSTIETKKFVSAIKELKQLIHSNL